MGDELMEFDGKNVKLERWGLNITGDIEWDVFSALGKKLMTVHDGIQFALGDWLNYGEARWGEKYREALEKTPYPYMTLAKFAWICNRFKPDIREQLFSQLKNFSFWRLVAVSRLPDDEVLAMLELGDANKWSNKHLAEEIENRYPRPGAEARERKIDMEDAGEQKMALSYPHYGAPKGPGFFMWFGMSELPLLNQILPKHPGTLLIRKRFEQVVDAKATT